MYQNNIMLKESSLSRVWKHNKDKNTTIVIFTAFRDEYSKEDNIKHNKLFASTLKSNGYGYFYVKGYFPENEGTDLEKQVYEESIFVTTNKKSNELIQLCHKLANSRNQDSIIVKDQSGVYFLDKNKNRTNLGELKPGKIGKYYSQLRNKKNKTFIFESEFDGMGYFESLRNFIENKT